jgi:hypothetical protein
MVPFKLDLTEEIGSHGFLVLLLPTGSKTTTPMAIICTNQNTELETEKTLKEIDYKAFDFLYYL